MNVLILTTHLNTGGVTSYLYTVSKGVVRLGHRVHIVSAGGNMEDNFRAAGASVVTLNIRTKSELDPKIYLALGFLKKYIVEQGIHCLHAQTRVTQVMGALLARMTGRPLVTTCHGYFKPRLSRRLFPCWGDKVIAISRAVQTHLQDDFKIHPGKIVLVESGIDLEEFSPANERLKIERRKQMGFTRQPVIGMIARLSDVKGQDILIEAMPQIMAVVPDAQLLLVGVGKMEKDLRAMVARLKLEARVQFIAEVNKINQVLSLFDVFVVPSRQEGLGLSVMEAQAAGLPVVASRVGGIPSLIEDGKTGVLVEPENPAALAAAIIALLQSPTRAREISLAGREHVARAHSAAGMVQKTADVYRGVVGGGTS